jgi:hypothetical protein
MQWYTPLESATNAGSASRYPVSSAAPLFLRRSSNVDHYVRVLPNNKAASLADEMRHFWKVLIVQHRVAALAA